HRGQLALPDAPAGLEVEKVVEKALVTGGVRLWSLREIVQELESPASDLRREWPVDHATLGDHRKAGQGQADGSDAARGGRVGLVPDQPVVGIGLVQVVQKCMPLEPVELVITCPDVAHRSLRQSM